MSQDRYGLYPATLTYAGPTTLDIQQIERVGVRPSAQKEIIIPAGNIDPSAVILLMADPAVDFDTDDIATVLAAVSPTAGLALTGAAFQLQKRADGGAFAAAGTGLSIAATKGFVYPKTLSVAQDGQGGAKLTCEMVAHYDGTTSGSPALPTPALVFADTVTLVSTPAFNARYYLGPIYANAAQIPGVQDWQLDFGIEYKTKRLDGDLAPQIGSIFSRKPKFTFSVLKVNAQTTIASLFNNAIPGALAFYLRKGAPGGARVADATAEHAKLSMAAGAWNADSIEVQGENDATLKVTAEPTGTIAFSAASAIP